MKKVLFVATITQHINCFHIPYLKWFKEQGFEVHVASNGEQKIEYCDKHYNLPFERFPLKKNNLKAYKELKNIIKNNNYQIIHCHTPVGGVLGRLAARKARKNGTRVIYTAHGFHFHKGAPILNWIVYYPVEKIMAKYTDCLITINEEDYERVKQIELINGVGIDERKFNIQMSDEEKKKLKNSIGLDERDIVLTYVAELNKNKNQIMLLKAMKELVSTNEKIKLLLVGDGNSKEYLQKNIYKNKLEKYIFLLGKRNDIPQILKITNIYISTSKREGLPVNVIEAMISGLPVIVTNCRGNRDLAKLQGNEFIVEINNVTELVECIKKALLKIPIKKVDMSNYYLNEILKYIK